ncbi:endonuclease domain-containing 1 protein-like [Denticeps clupeoides]|uniref:Endonuclease domain-containing 1 protein-like n=1 Tax=Denticeps clupeoides TaxID=299321 RepID=A0AAY4BLI5_9TELE|nr:endonuclease domain-containing 1 protein-like [Denticeps clupeoides]
MTPPALLLLLLFISLAEGHVVQSFKGTCGQFFITDPKDQNNHIPPTILTDNQDPDRYKQICQRYSSQYRYATLYDTQNRIPVYSAYQYTGHTKLKRKTTWMIEPQLDELTASRSMGSESKVDKSKRGNYQALNKDFNSTYHKGHLYPVCHNDNQPCAYATFTLTNAAPQTSSDNLDWYHKVEAKVNKELEKICNTAHIVTGVVPGSKWMKKDNREVNIPSHFWTAYCCTGKPGGPVTRAVLAQTNPLTIDNNVVTVDDLNQKLSSLYGSSIPATGFEVFGSVCK